MKASLCSEVLPAYLRGPCFRKRDNFGVYLQDPEAEHLSLADEEMQQIIDEGVDDLGKLAVPVVP